MQGNPVAGINCYSKTMQQVSGYGHGLLILVSLSFLPLHACTKTVSQGEDPKKSERMTQDKAMKSNSEWKEILSEEQFRITREKGTERAFSGKYWNTSSPGTYKCVSCGNPLFKSDTKFESGSGWPSFYEPLKQSAIVEKSDNTLMMQRTEVLCSNCDAHLGHVFDDGPAPTGLRYCLNSVALDLEPSTQGNK